MLRTRELPARRSSCKGPDFNNWTRSALQSNTMRIWEASWLDFIGLALAISFLEATIRGVGVTRGPQLAGGSEIPAHPRTSGRWLACARRGGCSDEIQSPSPKMSEIACFVNHRIKSRD